MRGLDFLKVNLKGGGTMILSISGLNKVREKLGMPPIRRPLPGEDPRAYREAVEPLRKETLDALRTASPGLCEGLFECKELE